jgi:hypothetical protein
MAMRFAGGGSDVGNRSAAWVLAIALSAVPAAAQTDEDYYYRVEAPSLRCIVEHIENYLASGQNPVFISVDECAGAEPRSLLDTLTNEAPDLSFKDPGAPDQFLSLSRSDLECLKEVSIPEADGVIRFYPALCRLDPEDDGS